jgi:hypothetical protein
MSISFIGNIVVDICHFVINITNAGMKNLRDCNNPLLFAANCIGQRK